MFICGSIALTKGSIANALSIHLNAPIPNEPIDSWQQSILSFHNEHDICENHGKLGLSTKISGS